MKFKTTLLFVLCIGLALAANPAPISGAPQEGGEPTFGTCKGNPLLSKIGISGGDILDAPAAPNGTLQYCTSLQNSSTCCSADAINSLPQYIQGQVYNLQNATSKIDKKFQKANGTLGNLTQVIQTVVSAWSNFNTTNATVAASLSEAIEPALEMAQAALANASQGLTQFPQYQISRASCQSTVVKLQGALRCAACNPNIKGVHVGGKGQPKFNIGKTLCQNITQSCAGFFQSSYGVTQAFKIEGLLGNLKGLVGQVGKLINGTLDAEDFELPPPPKAQDSEAIDVLPPNCENSTMCTPICKQLLNRGQVNFKLLTRGGKPNPQSKEGNDNQGIAEGEPNPSDPNQQGIAVGEPNPSTPEAPIEGPKLRLLQSDSEAEEESEITSDAESGLTLSDVSINVQIAADPAGITGADSTPTDEESQNAIRTVIGSAILAVFSFLIFA